MISSFRKTITTPAMVAVTGTNPFCMTTGSRPAGSYRIFITDSRKILHSVNSVLSLNTLDAKEAYHSTTED